MGHRNRVRLFSLRGYIRPKEYVGSSLCIFLKNNPSQVCASSLIIGIQPIERAAQLVLLFHFFSFFWKSLQTEGYIL